MGSSNFNIYIANVPPWYPSQPYLSVPLITGFLKDNGFTVFQKDINLSFFNNLLSKEEINLQFEHVHRSSIIEPNLEMLIKLQDYLIQNLDTFKSYLKENGNANEDKTKHVIKSLELILKVYGSKYPSINISFGSLQYNFDYFISENLVEYLENSQNFFSYYFEKYELNEISNFDINVLALSITSPEQLIPALSFLKVIRKHFATVKILLGGDYITQKHKVLVENSYINKLFDFIFIGDIDSTLIDFLILLRDGNEYSCKFSNIAFSNSKNLKKNPPLKPIFQILKANFEDLNLNDYFSKNIVLPVEISKGCYWGKCTFCEIKGKSYKQNSTNSIVSLLKTYNSRYHVINFAFVSSSPSPKFLHKIALELKEVNFIWSSFLRPTPYINKQVAQDLFDGGCRIVFLGIESASQKILNNMNKGLKIEETTDVLSNLYNAGIKIHGYFMFGYLGENNIDRNQTRDFIMENKEVFTSVSFTTYTEPIKFSKNYRKELALYSNLAIGDSLQEFLEEFEVPLNNNLLQSIEMSFE